MANSMLESILDLVSPEMKQSIASRLGESPQAVQSGLGTATAATLGALASKAGDSSFLSQIMNLISGTSGQNILGNLSSLASNGPSGSLAEVVNRFLPMVFGTQQSQVANLISERSGLSSASVGGLLRTVVPLILGYFGRMAGTGGLNVGSLASMLRAESPGLDRFLPTGLFRSAAGTVTSTASRAVADVRDTAGSSVARWLVPLGVLGALLVAWLVYRSLNTQTASNVKPVATAAVDSMNNAASTAANKATAAWAALGDFFKTKLPDGTELDIPSLGVEAKLLKYLNDGSAPADKDTWFDFDRLLFDTGSATLQPASDEQLHNIAEILKAYPNVKIRIGGYTDNTGDAAANLKLSQDRADNVMKALVDLGVDPSRMTAKGYGSEHPVADNSTEDGRQQNRRISMRVTAK